jgi:hypothetical protein
VAEHLGLRRARRQAALETLADDLDKQTGYALGLIKVPGKRARPRRGRYTGGMDDTPPDRDRGVTG